MDQRDRQLRREIFAVVIIKLVLITALWWGFIRDQKVAVDEASITRHLGTPESANRQPPLQGEPNAQ